MKLTFAPVRMDTPLSLHRQGDTLAFNGVPVDLPSYDAATAPCAWIVGQPALGPAGWEVTVILPHGADAPPETLFPAAIEAGEGPVTLPPFHGPALTEDLG